MLHGIYNMGSGLLSGLSANMVMSFSITCRTLGADGQQFQLLGTAATLFHIFWVIAQKVLRKGLQSSQKQWCWWWCCCWWRGGGSSSSSRNLVVLTSVDLDLRTGPVRILLFIFSCLVFVSGDYVVAVLPKLLPGSVLVWLSLELMAFWVWDSLRFLRAYEYCLVWVMILMCLGAPNRYRWCRCI